MKNINWKEFFREVIESSTSTVIFWALCVAFMNYGICWRTFIAFMVVVAINNGMHCGCVAKIQKLIDEKRSRNNEMVNYTE